MKDTELRGIILQKYYEERRNGLLRFGPEDFPITLTEYDIAAICQQLGEHGLLHWSSAKVLSGADLGFGRISALGIDVIEGSAQPGIKIEFVQNKSVNVSGSTNVIVGDHNTMTVANHIEGLAKAIDSTIASADQKQEAKNRLHAFLKHPLVTTLAGASAGALAKALT